MNTDLEDGRGLTEQSDSVPPRKRVARDRLLAEDTAGARKNLSARLPDEPHRNERMKIVLVEDSPMVRERLVAIVSELRGATIVGYAEDADRARESNLSGRFSRT